MRATPRLRRLASGFADIAALGDHLTTWVFDGDPADPAVLLELAGRCQAWLEHIAATEAR